MRIDDLMQDGNYLPACLRDFHAQKRIFKRIDEIVQRRREKHAQDWKIGDTGLITWIDAHVYVIDFFLWYMARLYPATVPPALRVHRSRVRPGGLRSARG